MSDNTKTPGTTAPNERPSPLRLILASRKGVVFLVLMVLIGFASAGFIFLVLHEAWAGRSSIDAAMTKVFGTIIGAFGSATLAAIKLIGAFEGEDVAKINASAPKQPVNQQVNAPNASIDLGSGDHAPTPAETPAAKQSAATDSGPSGHS